jgi:hypothetical protein
MIRYEKAWQTLSRPKSLAAGRTGFLKVVPATSTFKSIWVGSGLIMFGRYKSVLLQFQESFPNGGRAEANLLEKAANGDPFARSEFPRKNSFLDRKIDFVPEDGFCEGFKFRKRARHLIYQISNINFCQRFFAA